ncbi:DUF115 domain-containing protein [Selenomonas caprae]|uniref:DUF115 domain-containing protein n=2 Tax=Selenomonas caprae TaxID=2606905 RepID=A0A5D6WLZ1_9FIRM|nr:DUF115 domain-containing protein [Selenomonas caprae]
MRYISARKEKRVIDNMLEFVVWGAGLRGKRLHGLLGQRIVAFIDKNHKVMDSLEGIPVISFERYQKDYAGYPIIVSPLYADEINLVLHDYKDIPVIYTVEEPSEISLGMPVHFGDLNLSRFPKELPLYIYGINLFAILLYEYLKQHGWQEVSFLPGLEGITFEQAQQLGIRVETKPNNKNVILCAEKNIETASCVYPANRIEDFWNLALQMDKYHHPELRKYFNIHKRAERRLFIVATGPSLRLADLDRLHEKNELCMSVNMVYRCFDRTQWRPDYYLFEDMHGLTEYEHEVRDLKLPNIFLADTGISQWSAKPLGENMHVYHLSNDRVNGWPRFSKEISRFVSGGRTVVFSCLQMAMYMGFKEIYLIGADCDYKGMPQDEGNHFIEEYCSRTDKQPRTSFPVQETFVSYQVARHYAEEKGVKIYNATRGGKLEVFERVDFDSLF